MSAPIAATEATPDSAAVLLVDDEESILSALKRRLARNWDVHCALSAKEAFEKLEQKPCALVVSDLHMPAMDGIEFFTQLHRTHPNTIRIMLTGDQDRSSLIRAINQGHVYRFLNKPCPAESVELALQDGLEIFRLQQEQRLLESQKLAAARRMAKVGELSTRVADELAQVIQLVQSNAAMAQAHAADPNLALALKTIERAVQHGAALTRRLTSLCVQKNDQLPYRSAAERFLPLLNELAGPDLAIEFRCDSSFDCDNAAAPVLGRILAGLVSHAREQSRGGGQLRVSLATVDINRSRAKLHRGARPGIHFSIEVSNPNYGVTPETAQHLYAALLGGESAGAVNADELQQLARLVSDHFGWVQVRSDVGKGTTIRVFLPRETLATRRTTLRRHEP